MGQMRLVDEGSPPMVRRERAAELILSERVEACNAEAAEQERMEGWIMAEVAAGAALPGLYPMNAETWARYEAGRAAK